MHSLHGTQFRFLGFVLKSIKISENALLSRKHLLLLLHHPFIQSLLQLKGNARGCVYTEPLWGIPFNLYAPYVSVYMLALGLTDSQIGLLASIGLGFQVFTALLSGAITDKLGRRRATYIFDLLSWSVPTLIWAFSQNFWYFLVAAVINSVWRVTMNSWSCLLVEDTDPELLVDIYSWIYIAGQVVAFVAPLAGLLIHQFGLVPAVRGLYFLAFIMMTIKFIATNAMTTETRQGLKRMEETRHQSLPSMMGEYRGVVSQILRTPATLITLGLMLVVSIFFTVNNTFWAILATEKIHIPEQHLALFPFIRSSVMLIFFFTIMPRLRHLHFRNPMLIGYAIFIVSQALLLITPEKGYLLLGISVLLEACAIPLASTLMDKMVVLTVDPQERARILAILYVIVIIFTSPFGWIGGQLSEFNRLLPFVLNLGVLAVGAFLVYLAGRLAKEDSDDEPLPASAA
jgi:MFS family permease